MKGLPIIISALLMLCAAGCGGSSSELMALVEERDSLRDELRFKQNALDTYSQAVATINATLDSMDIQDQRMFTGTDENPVTRDQILANLNRYEAILVNQQTRIRQLERSMGGSSENSGDAQRLIAHLNAQIANKNRQINQLREELENRNVDIARLQRQVESQNVRIEEQTVTINQLSERNQRQGEALARQDAMLNNAYVVIGSKNDLKRKGIIHNNRVVANSSLDRSRFFQVDIRQWREITFSARRPQIKTSHPTTAYELLSNGNNMFTLRISNPTDFWRMSNYLVIQTD